MEENQVQLIHGYRHLRYHPIRQTAEESLYNSRKFLSEMQKRRSIRHFSTTDVAQEIIENIVMTAGTAPSGAHKQPWTFCVVHNPAIKSKIREAAEKEEYESYHNRMPESWLRDLAPLGTDWRKPFLEDAPWLIIVFKRVFELDAEGEKHTNYYVNESVGIACGMLITAIHTAGLVTLTHTPSPMNFLTQLLERPANERPYLLLPVGYPAEEVYVPDLNRKSLQETAVFY